MAKQVTTNINIKLDKAIANLAKYEKKVSKLRGELNKTKQRQKEFAVQANKGVKSGTQSLKNFAKGLIGISVAFLVLRKTIKNIADFEKAIANLSAITGATGKDLDFYKKKAIEMSNASTLAAKDVVEAFKLVGSAVPELLKSKEALAQVTEAAIVLSEAAGIDLNLAAKALGETLNQFQLPASEATRVINALAAASQLGAKEIPFVNEALAKFAGNARSMGISVEESVAAIETLGKVIPQAEIAGTSLRNILLKMDLAAEKQGRTINSLAEELELLAPIVDSTTKLSAKFEKRYVLAIRTLIEGRKEFKALTEGITGTNTAFEQQITNTATLTDSFTKLGNAWTNFTLGAEAGAGTLSDLLNGVRKRLILLGTDLVSFWEKASLSADGAFKLYLKRLEAQKKGSSDRIKQIKQEIDFYELQIANLRTLQIVDEAAIKLIQDKIDLLEEEQGIRKKDKEDAENKEKIHTIGDLLNELAAVNTLIKETADTEAAIAPLRVKRNAIQKRLNDLLGKTAKSEREAGKAAKEAAKEQAKATEELTSRTEKLKAENTKILITTIEEEQKFKLDALNAELDANILAIEQGKATDEAKNKAIIARLKVFKTEEKRIKFDAEQAIFDQAEQQAEKDNALATAATDFQISEARRAQNAISALKQEAVRTGATVLNDLLQVSINNTRNAATQEIEIEREKAQQKLNLAGNNAQLIADINKDLDDKIEDIQKEAAEREKTLAILQATVDFAAGVVSIWASNSGIPVVGVGIAVGLTALLAAVYGAQLALIDSQSFAEGTIGAMEGWANVGEQGKEIVWMPQGAKVFNNKAVNAYDEAIDSMNKGTFENTYIDKKELVGAAKKYEDNKQSSFADNIANSMIMQMEMKGVQTEMYELNRKESWSNYVLEKMYEHMSGKKLL